MSFSGLSAIIQATTRQDENEVNDMSELERRQGSGRRFGCPSCGGGLQYDIASGKMKCDRCGGPLAEGRTQSMYNADVICMECKRRERERPDYGKAVEADIAAVKAGNWNFKGIGLDNEDA